MLKKILLAAIFILLLPVLAQANAYLIVVDEAYLKNPNLAGKDNGPPLPVIDELKAYFKAEVDVVGINLNDVNPIARYASRKPYALIITLGTEVSEIGHKAALSDKRYKYALIDCDRINTLPENATAYRFSGSFGAFLSGYIAGKMSQRNQIGFIGGKKTDFALDMVKAFKEGARRANPDIRITTDYLRGFFDHRAAMFLADRFFNTNIDIIFHVSEYSGAGILQSAKRTNKWTIGINTDLYPELDRGNILTSVSIDYNMAIMEACIAVENDKFTGGESILLTLSNYGVDLGDTTKVPAEIMEEVEQLKAELLDGTIKLTNNKSKIIK